jgi:hypothetical protein
MQILFESSEDDAISLESMKTPPQNLQLFLRSGNEQFKCDFASSKNP